MRNYVIKVLNGMALGLFSTLLIGLIIKQIGILADIDYLIQFGEIAQRLMGAGIGAGVSYSLGASPLGIFASIVTGTLGAGSIRLADGMATIVIGEPVGALIASLIGAEISKLVSGKTKVDIVLVPISTIIVGGLAGNYIAPVITTGMNAIGSFINMTTELHPLPMGILVSLTMGIILTLPISSAALAISLNLSGLAAAAATVGCASNMIGFAVASYEENGFGGFIAQGLGTSMLQISNIVKNPLIWLPAIISSIILGPVSSVILKMESNMVGAGMGTSGLVGQFAVIDTMGVSNEVLLMILAMHFILPAIISYTVNKYMRKKGYIKYGDMKIN